MTVIVIVAVIGPGERGECRGEGGNDSHRSQSVHGELPVESFVVSPRRIRTNGAEGDVPSPKGCRRVLKSG